MSRYRMIDLFAGIGGIRLGFERAFDDAETVFISEIDAYARATYAENFPDSPPIEGDITQIPAEKIPPFDICLAGFPCQAFSIAGRRGGFDDDYHGICRGTLFLDVVRICDYHKPKIIFCENVKGLVNHDKGRTFKIICAAFEQIGYKIFHAVLNSRDFGLPQNRERIYIVCFRNDIAPEKFQFPAPSNEVFAIADILDYAPIPAKYYLSDVYLATLRRHRELHEAKGHGFGYEVKALDGVANALVCGGMGRERNLIVDARHHSKIPTTKIHGAINDENIRKLTPREWARLQGFPENFRLPLSDTQLYKQFGNSVSINVIEAIAAEIRSVIDMAFNKGEWSELYVMLRLMADGAINSEVNGKNHRLLVEKVFYENINGFKLDLHRQKNFVTLYWNGDRIKKIPADDFAGMANTILDGIRCGKGRAFEIYDAVKILQKLGLTTLKSPCNKKADINLTIHAAPTTSDKPVGYSIKSYLGSKPTLFNASKNNTNFRFKIFGMDDALAERINSIDTHNKIIDRLNLIERLEFDSVCGRTFAKNLSLIDSNMGKILGEMLKLFYVERISGCAELATRLEEDDPLKIGVENFYRINIKKFLRAVALGLRPADVWNGRNEAEGGYIVVKRNAEIVLYPLHNYDDFETYLLNDTKLETPDPNRHNFAKISGARSSSTSTCKFVSNKKIPNVQSSVGDFFSFDAEKSFC